MNITRETAEKLAEVLGGDVSGKKIVFYHNGFGGKTETITLDYNGLMPLAQRYIGDFHVTIGTDTCNEFYVECDHNDVSKLFLGTTLLEALALAIISIKETEQ